MTLVPDHFWDFMEDGDFKKFAAAEAAAYPYVYFWHRQGRKGQRCKVTARGKMNSCCVEFEDGYKMITSRNALRRTKSLRGEDEQ